MSIRGNQKAEKGVDIVIITLVTVLLLFGLVSLLNVLSDPFDGTEVGLEGFLSRLNMEYFNRQLVSILLSLAVVVPLAMLDYEQYKPFVKAAYAIACLLLLMLLIVKVNTRGVFGWFKIGTSRAFQPSEISKVVVLVALSKYVSECFDRRGHFNRFVDVLGAVVIFGVPFLLVLRQPDLGTAMVFAAIFIGVVFAARISWLYIIGGGAAAVLSLPLIYRYLLDKDQRARIRVFLNPTLDLEGDGYNVLRSKELVGSGGLWGKGYFTPGTLAQHKYVPERQTDFIFSGIAEGIGFVGSAILILLFFLLLLRILWVARHSKDMFGRCLCAGTVAMLGFHVFENIGMNMGLLPVTGIPLPLISYGGSNMMATLCTIGIVLSVRYRAVNRGQIR
ncbi:MAG: rod shape-determining protein RodA [Clostridia bacterium]|nr:rod shape-determining protein RodA [Clostridia bacterium]